MTKILGLDLGTNSIGWAVVEKEKQNLSLVDKGVRIFQEGVKIEKGIESSKAAERTSFRSARRLKFRRKLRKIETLKILSEFGYCPELNQQELNDWRYKKIYPENPEFRKWWLTDEEGNKNPYYFRDIAATQNLDLSDKNNRFLIGRAFYHMAQRRGFLSNRLEGTKESEGAVKKNIEEINKAKGEKTLGQYFSEKYAKGEKIRNQYTHREYHYLEEFNRICEKQQLPGELKNKLHNAIFYQRPLKSQKGLIGKCVFEPKKQRCAVSHPLFEEYRMLCFINNIRIKTPEDEKMRPLNESERLKTMDRFYLKREHFPFEDIAKQLAPKKQYKYFKDRNKNPEDYLFNYKMNTTVSGNPVSARFKDLFGEGFLEYCKEHIRSKDGKKSTIDINDVWHVLMTFDSEDKLLQFAREKLQLTEEQSQELIKIKPKGEFSNLSLNAIKKILPWLREGMIYSHAVIMANMPEVLPQKVWNDPHKREEIDQAIRQIIRTQNEEKAIVEIVNGLVKNTRDSGEAWSKEAEPYYRNDLVKALEDYFGEKRYSEFPEEDKNRIENNALELFRAQMQKNAGRGDFAKIQTIDERVKDFLVKNYGLDENKIGKVYHPAAIEVYKPVVEGKDGKKYLGSPMVSSIRNPMAMRALHQLRKVINELIEHGLVDEQTKINIEMSRGLLNANERAGLQRWQRDRENARKQYADKISEHYKAQGVGTIPSEDDIIKYQLWEEQNHKCIYTGEEIGLSEFLGASPKYDIEHTIPRSLSFDNSQENKTLCENRFNRSVKKNKIPFELSNYPEIRERVDSIWKDKIEELEKAIERTVRDAKTFSDNKDKKDQAIQKRHRLVYERNYYRNKLNRFYMEEVPQGFKNSQLVDTGIISKYSRLYLKTLFDKVYTVKGRTVSDFRNMWGLQEEYRKKERVNHVHHCVDAVVVACMTKEQYENLAKYYHDKEDSFIYDDPKRPRVEKPWTTFTEDVKKMEEEILVSHHTGDVLPKQSRKKLRKRGRVVKDEKGNPVYQQGDTVRGSLHKETFYGAIEREVENKKGEKEKQIKYVVRKSLDSLEDGSIKHIVDERVREIVETGRKKEKELTKEIEALKKKRQKADETEEKAIDEQIRLIQKQIEDLYSLPNKNGDPVPIKKVRIFTPTVTNPIHLKKQRDKSVKKPKPYKEHFHVANDGNYLMAIYENKDEKGKLKRDFELRTNLEAGEYFKHSVQKELLPQGIKGYEGLVPEMKTNGNLELPLKYIIKIGTQVIFWEKSPDEVWELNYKEIRKRLYKIIGLTQQRIKGSGSKIYEFATVVLRYHQEARPASDLKIQDGSFVADEVYKGQRRVNHNQFNVLVEGFDFEVNPMGKVIPTRK